MNVSALLKDAISVFIGTLQGMNSHPLSGEAESLLYEAKATLESGSAKAIYWMWVRVTLFTMRINSIRVVSIYDDGENEDENLVEDDGHIQQELSELDLRLSQKAPVPSNSKSIRL